MTVNVSPSALGVTITGAGVASAGNSITATGGTAPYTFAWTRANGSLSTISSASSSSPVFSAPLASGQSISETWAVTVTDAANATATGSVTLNFVSTESVLVLSTCGIGSSTAPTAASATCSLSNSGQAAASSISYAGPSGTAVTGPPTCAANSECGMVTIVTGTTAGSYSGNLTVTPNTGKAITMPVNLAVQAPPAAVALLQ